MARDDSRRVLVTLVREIAAERGIRLTSFSDDWILCLEKDGRVAYVFGYDFTINSATAKNITRDKAATSELLAHHGVPCIEHRIVHGPQMAEYVPSAGNWRFLTDYFEQHGRDLVCKPNEGTGGQGVFRVRTLAELEAAVQTLFQKHRSICVSPFERFGAEYRVAVFRGACRFLYEKQRPVVAGDGVHTLRRLAIRWLESVPDLSAGARLLADLAWPPETLDRVPAAGERIEINWRHNLGQGATPRLLDPAQHADARALALEAARVLGVDLASVDVVETARGLEVLELNAGIMMESFARLSPESRELAKRFYDDIVGVMLESAPALST
jgi:D-alanine-D-alanine ligase-like ATP-grasp enzyme